MFLYFFAFFVNIYMFREGYSCKDGTAGLSFVHLNLEMFLLLCKISRYEMVNLVCGAIFVPQSNFLKVVLYAKKAGTSEHTLLSVNISTAYKTKQYK